MVANSFAAFLAWQQEVKQCERCPLAETRTQVVINDLKANVWGNDDFDQEHWQGWQVFLLGEAPGGQEDQKGIPFCGQAGGILNDFLSLAQLERAEVYISNVVKCRPVKPSTRGKYGNYANRKPKKAEQDACRPWLEEEIRFVQPKLLVPLGNVPLSFVLGKTAAIGEYHGKYFWSDRLQVGVFPLYHPAALIYDASKKAVYKQDVMALGALCRQQLK